MAKQLLRLQAYWRSSREAARRLQISRTTVGDCLDRADKTGLSWSLPGWMTEAELARAMFPTGRGGGGTGNGGSGSLSAGGCMEPDWNEVDRELR